VLGNCCYFLYIARVTIVVWCWNILYELIYLYFKYIKFSFSLRRVTTDTNLVYSSHVVLEQPFQRYNLAKFPCNLKRLQTSYEKLIEICVITPGIKQNVN
jgi:hypothetical protein